MKSLVIIILFGTNIYSQNLVPNPSFEEHTGCPMFYPDLDGKCDHWLSFKGSPDYLNNCSSVAGYNNQFGYQKPHTGEAYVGIGTFTKTVPNLREHIGIKLIEPLIIDQKYYFSCFVSSGYTPLQINIATNKIGALLTTYEYSDPDLLRPLPNFSTIVEEAIITDTINWVKISGEFIADSAYEYLVLGSFFDDDNIDTFYFPYQVVPQAGYYFIDDVCLSTDSLYTHTWSTANYNELEKEHILIYQNHAFDDLKVKTNNSIESIEIIDNLGKTVLFKPDINKTESSIQVNHLETGLYHIRVKTNSPFYYYSKILININP